MTGGDWRGLELATVGCKWLELIVTKAITEPYNVKKQNYSSKRQEEDFFSGIFSI